MKPATTDYRFGRRGGSAAILLLAAVCFMNGPRLSGFDPRDAAGRVLLPARPGAGAAITYPDFSGEWKIDHSESDSLAPVLRAKGMSLLEIVAASRMPVTYRIQGNSRRLTVSLKTPFVEQTEELMTDGTPTRFIGLEGHVAEAVTRWSDDRRALITTTSDRVGVRLATVRLARSLTGDGQTMYIRLDYVLPEGERIQIRRVFRRAGSIDSRTRADLDA